MNQAEQSVMCLVLLDDRRVLRLCVDFTELSTCMVSIHPAISLGFKMPDVRVNFYHPSPCKEMDAKYREVEHQGGDLASSSVSKILLKLGQS